MIFCDINRFCVAKFKWRADVNNIRGIGAPCCFHPFVNRKDFAFRGGRRQIKENQLGGKPWLNVARIHALLILNFIIPNFIYTTWRLSMARFCPLLATSLQLHTLMYSTYDNVSHG